MTSLVVQRLHNQKLSDAGCRRATDVVRWLGAVQAQEFRPAKWAIGLRAAGVTEGDVDAAFDRGLILRTHVMRPTWHFVPAADIRWMLELTGPRVSRRMATYDRALGLDAPLVARSHDAIARALEGGRFLTRTELAEALARAGIALRGQRLGHVMLQAELERVVCSGPGRGRHLTYALFEERAPRAGSLPRDEALAELAWRYFRSHGPATLRDFSWWSGLAMVDVRAAVALCGRRLREAVVDGRRCWQAARAQSRPGAGTHLLPIYDEYLIAYRERDGIVHPAARAQATPDPYGHWVIVDGRLAGSWRQIADGGRSRIRVATSAPMTRASRRALAASARRLAGFSGTSVSLAV